MMTVTCLLNFAINVKGANNLQAKETALAILETEAEIKTMMIGLSG